jgi:hypothetical protein
MQYDAHVHTYHDERPVTFAKAKTVHALIDLAATNARKEGFAAGAASVRSFQIDEHFGTTTTIMVVHAKSRRALSRRVADLNPGHIDTGCGHDCSGRVCGQSARLIRAYRSSWNGGEWVGVVECSVSIDV